jgi:hypothetical protein
VQAITHRDAPRMKAGWKYGLEAAVMSTAKPRILLKKKW